MGTVRELCKLDSDILQGLYKYRALSTEQLQHMYRITNRYTYIKLAVLRERGYIKSEAISGYQKGVRNQGKYHRISDTGIACLQNEGLDITRQAFQLKPSKDLLPFLLATNDLIVHLEAYGWEITDGRQVKADYKLNRSDNIQGILEHEEESVEYGLYVFLEKTGEKNLQKTVREIRDYKAITDFMVFTRGYSTYIAIVNALLTEDSGNVVARRSSIKIFPHGFGKIYLRHFWDEENVLKYLSDYYKVHYLRKLSKEEVVSDGLDTIVTHEGEEKYLVNLIDTDLKKIFNIKQYRKEKYEQEGRKVLVVTHIAYHKELLSSIHHVDYIDVHPKELTEYLQLL